MKDKVKFNVSGETNNIETSDDFTDEVSLDSESIEGLDAEEATAEDLEDTIEDEVEEEFYVGGIYDELRDAMQDTDFRLFLINNDIVIPGTLEGNEIQFLDIVGEDEDKEFVMKPAPSTFDELLDFRTLYNVTNSELEIPEDKEVQEAPHEEIVEYILNLKVTDQDADDVEDDEQEIKSKENDEDKEEDDDENNEQ